MRALPRILLVLAFVWLSYILFTEARAAQLNPDTDASKVVMLFAGVLLVGGTGGVLFVTMVLPMLTDAVGDLFVPNEQIEKPPHADALAAVARGDYEAAIEAYGEAVEKDPDDTLALSEMAKIHCEQFENPGGAVEVLEQALQREWPPDSAAFLSMRLVEVYWKHQHDARSARALLLQIIETMPGTKQSANAEHRLREIEQQLSLEE